MKRVSVMSAIMAFLFMIVQVLADLYLPNLTSDIINNGVAKGDIDYIWHTGFVMIGFSLISIVAAICNTYFATRESQKLGKELRSSIYEKRWFFEHFYSSTYFWIFNLFNGRCFNLAYSFPCYTHRFSNFFQCKISNDAYI